jgi:MFS family permease
LRFKQVPGETAITPIRNPLTRLAADGLLRSADFRRLWLSSALTQFGSQITLLALPICAVLLMHATPSQMGLLAAFESLPFLLFGLPSGVLPDRRRRLPIMMCSDLLVAMALASVPLAVPSGCS